MKLLIDADTGVDDSIALIYAFHQPDVQVMGITTTHGNVDPYQAAVNTCRILDLVKAPRDIPVVVGAVKPLEEEWSGVVEFIHGADGIGNVELPASDREIQTRDVSDFIMETARACQGELTIVTLGPLTNLAEALLKYPQLPRMVKRVVMMGGAVAVQGNVSPVAEANIAGDPRACDIVFTSGMDVTVVGLDVTTKTRLKKEHLELVKNDCLSCYKAEVDYIRQALVHYLQGNRIQKDGLDDCPLHDPLAMIAVFHPELITIQKRKARVECEGQYCKGMVVTDTRGNPFEAEYVSFAIDVEGERAIRELLSVFWTSR